MIAGVIDLLSRHKAGNVYTRPRIGRILFAEHCYGQSRVGLARSGSAPRSGRGGRRFKSCHSDQHLAESLFS
jgi:hypothetical protein